MTSLELTATSREVTGKKVKRLRLKGLMPAVVYGHGVDKPMNLSVDQKLFQKVYKKAGTSSLVDLKIDDQKPVKVLFTEPQIHYLTSTPVHADFRAIKMSEKLETAIPINYIGESAAVVELEGNFISNKDELNVKCLPGDLIPSIEVDLSILKTFDDQIKVSDLKLPSTIEVLDDSEEVIATVAAPISEEELEAELAEDKTAEEAAVEELGKTGEEGEETEAEGENPPVGGPAETPEEPAKE
ncbi:MAG TPA: 50S ribosomal protein L25 [Candidatus Saccharimonadales bacterium]|nr:50S ribosomal protein L25 [Candidatus Saccharimonadales bacterium]